MYNKRAGCFLQYLFFFCFVLMCWWLRYKKESFQSNHSLGCIRRKSHPCCGSVFLEVLEIIGAFKIAETCNTLQKSLQQRAVVFMHIQNFRFSTSACYFSCSMSKSIHTKTKTAVSFSCYRKRSAMSKAVSCINGNKYSQNIKQLFSCFVSIILFQMLTAGWWHLDSTCTMPFLVFLFQSLI